MVVSGIDAGDGVFMLFDFFNYSTTVARSDLNCTYGMAHPADLSVFRDFLFDDGASSAPQATTYCP